MQDYIPRKIDINGQIGTITVKQFDNNSRFLHVQITDNDAVDGEFDLTDCSANLYVQPEGNTDPSNVMYFSGETSSDEENGNIVTFLLPGDLTQNVGRYECEIWIHQGDESNPPVISSKPFILVVEKSIRNTGAIEASSQFSALDEALAVVTDLRNGIRDANGRIDELSDALEEKANLTDIPDVSSFIDADVDNLTNYYDKDAVDNALAEKQDALTAGDNISIAEVNGELTISATDTKYSAGTGISLSGTTISNSGVREISTGSANGTISVNTGGTSADVTVKGLGTAAFTPISNYATALHTHEKNQITDLSNATVSADGLMSAADKLKINGINAGTAVVLRPGNSTINLINSDNEIDLGSDINFADYSAVDIRYLQYSTGSVNCYATLRVISVNGAYGNIPVIKYSSGTISPLICIITLTGSKIQVVDDGGTSQLFLSAVVGYK